VLDDNLEAALVIFGVLAVFLEGDDDLLLILSALVLALQEHKSGWFEQLTLSPSRGTLTGV
jgi:hypothetical protein